MILKFWENLGKKETATTQTARTGVSLLQKQQLGRLQVTEAEQEKRRRPLRRERLKGAPALSLSSNAGPSPRTSVKTHIRIPLGDVGPKRLRF